MELRDELQKKNDEIDDINFESLDITSEEISLDEIDEYIQANLENEYVQEALKKGVDLRHFSKQVESELLEVENASIQDYIAESQNIASLHKQIASCDSVLQTMEEMLQGFQNDLGSISSEIQTLQEQSIAMDVKLKNRQSVRGELSQFVDEMVVPESMINHILDTSVTEREFLEQLHELNHKINFVKEQSFKDSKSCIDVKDILERLKVKAITKIREYLLQKIYQFRKSMTNYQIPQNALLKFRFFNEFLLSNERVVAKEIRDEYIDTMSKVYYSYFKSYLNRLLKLQFEEGADREDLMGIEDTARRGFFAARPVLKNRSTVFTVGNRGTILTTDLEAPIIVPHSAQKSEQKYPFESLFRSLHYALLDNSCREFLFLSDFFMCNGVAAQELFNAVMGKTLAMYIKQMDSHVTTSFDSISLFLCIHVIYRYRNIAISRNVPGLNRYWETLLELIAPRFEFILQLNIQSIKDCDPQKLGHIDVRPHYITRRYAEFSAAIVEINESQPNERVKRVLTQLRSEVESFVLRMAAEFPSRKQQLVFLINNYDMMLGVILERTQDDSRESDSFKQLLAARTQEYIEETLAPHFLNMINFVKEAETLIDSHQSDALKSHERRITQIVRSFNSDWKKSIESINNDVMMSFTNFKNGTQILQGSLTQLIQYYHRFQKVLSQHSLKNLAIKNELINIHHVMVEVKKHKATF